MCLTTFKEAQAQTDTTNAIVVTPLVQPVVITEAAKKKAWYEILSIRGYAQIRYNRLLETNPDLKCDQCDKSLGEGGGLFIRRARLIFSGNVHERVFVYIQPDIASSPSSTTLNFFQLRDAYFDVALDKNKEYRFRVGQSKIPYGFENLQSSSNRLPLDRNDGINSAIANERDLGVFFYYAPSEIRRRFEELTSLGLKGSGDYGVAGIGVYNGQTANKPEANDDLHVVARVSYPFKLKNGQFIEPGIQAYTGKYVVTKDQISSGVNVEAENQLEEGFTDQRIAATLVIYPQPLGFQAEYNIGEGPEYDPATKTIKVKDLHGGYAQAMYMMKLNNQVLIPFLRVQYYDGGKKHEKDAASYLVYQTEIGAEWQIVRNLELTAMYSIEDRTVKNAQVPLNRQHGNRLRLQAQFNF
ncbi:porin [Pontibacter sp. SD6]|uniref:Porin n=2 Tax=Pontibacter cellulosilyticus TaxID=1720253 RepID=A0A923N6Q3_9BACT|nr:porin [Pontibacter cellulosilyticus]